MTEVTRLARKYASDENLRTISTREGDVVIETGHLYLVRTIYGDTAFFITDVTEHRVGEGRTVWTARPVAYRAPVGLTFGADPVSWVRERDIIEIKEA